MASKFINRLLGKSVIVINALEEQTREGINKAYIPKFLYKPPYGFPRFANMTYIRYLAQTPYCEMCIKTIIDEIAAIEWEILPTKGMEDQADEAEIEHIKNFFNNPNTNRETFEQVFVKMPVRDLLEVNSGILNKVYNMKEKMVEIVARDGATFTRNPNVHGMYTYRDDIILPNKIVDDSIGQEYLNPWTEITATSARERAAYFQYGWIAGPIPIPFGRKEIIWIESMKRTDDHYGYSPIQILAKNLQMLLYMIESDLEYYNDNNVPKGIIGLDDSDSEEIQAFKDQWYESQRTKDEFGNWKKIMNKVPITNKVPKFTRIEFSASEMQVIEKQKWYTKMVWASFGVTPTELGYTEDAKGSSNQIVQSKVFRKKAINPILRNLEQSYNMHIISEFDYWGNVKTKSGKTIRKPKYEFVFKKFDVDDERQKAELYKIQLETFRTVNEVRQDEGLDPVAGGDDVPTLTNKQNNNFNFGDLDLDGTPKNPKPGEDDDDDGTTKEPNVNQNPEGDKRNTDGAGQKAASADPANPLLLDEGERPTGHVKLERAIIYVNKQNEDAIKRLVAEAMGKRTLDNVKAEEKDLNAIIQKIKGLLSMASLKTLTNAIIKNNYMKGWDQAEQDLNINILPDQNAIDYIQSYTYENIKGMNDDIAQKLRQVMQRGFMDGIPLEKMKAEITKVFDVGDNRAEMISRTESNRAANFGRLHGYQKSGAKGKKVYSAHIDHRTSELCKRLNGQEQSLDDNFVDPQGKWEGMVPPSHPNCRSSWICKLEEDD